MTAYAGCARNQATVCSSPASSGTGVTPGNSAAEPVVRGLRVADVAGARRPVAYLDRLPSTADSRRVSSRSDTRVPNARFTGSSLRHPAQHRVGEHAGHGADVREVARLAAVAVDEERLAAQRRVDERRDDRRVRVAGRLQRSVHVEETEGQHGQAEPGAVRERVRLGRELAGRRTG